MITIQTLKTVEFNTNRMTDTIVFVLLLKTNYNQAINYEVRMKLMIGKVQANMKVN